MVEPAVGAGHAISTGEKPKTLLLSPFVIKDDGIYKMWYARSLMLDPVEYPDRSPSPEELEKLLQRVPVLREVPEDQQWTWFIHHATSPDGLNWTDHGTVLEPGVFSGLKIHQIFLPSVLKDDGGYRMWFGGREVDTHTYRIFHTTSSNGIEWETPVLAVDLGPPGSPDDTQVSTPYVLKDDGIYKLWYSGFRREDREVGRLLYAESEDGIEWEKKGVAIDLGPPGAHDSKRAGGACVIRRGGEYWMWYGGTGEARYQVRGMAASSDDGVNWRKRGLALDLGSEGSQDEFSAFNARVVRESDDLYRMYYSADGKGAKGIRKICYAEVIFEEGIPRVIKGGLTPGQ